MPVNGRCHDMSCAVATLGQGHQTCLKLAAELRRAAHAFLWTHGIKLVMALAVLDGSAAAATAGKGGTQLLQVERRGFPCAAD